MGIDLHLVVVNRVGIERERRRAHGNRTVWRRAGSAAAEPIEIEAHTTRVVGISVTVGGRGITIARSIVAIRARGIGTTRDTAAVDWGLGEGRGLAEDVVSMGHVGTVHGGSARLVLAIRGAWSAVSGVTSSSRRAAVLEIRRRGVERASTIGGSTAVRGLVAVLASLGLLLLPVTAGASLSIAMGGDVNSRIFRSGAIVVNMVRIAELVSLGVDAELVERIRERGGVIITRTLLSGCIVVRMGAFDSTIDSVGCVSPELGISTGGLARFEAVVVAVGEHDDFLIGRLDDGFGTILGVLSLG